MSDLYPNQLNETLRRRLPEPWNPRQESALAFHTNDYLALAIHPDVIAASQAATQTHGAGATGSRLLSGNFHLHTQLESDLAAFKSMPAALLFNTGFAANAALLGTLPESGDLVVGDRLNHASLIDGALSSRAKVWHYDHADLQQADTLLSKPCSGRKWIVSDAVFSMDGDIADLPGLLRLAKKHDALLILDEAHSTGVLGKTGRGIFEHFEIKPDATHTLLMGTCGKALGSFGAFVACSEAVREILINKARAFIYSTALPPAVLGATQGALDVLKSNPHLPDELRQKTEQFRQILNHEGISYPAHATPIFPFILGSAERALSVASTLRDQGILAMAVRPPTVPEGTSRLRLSITLHHDHASMSRLAKILGPLIGGKK